MAVTYGQAYTTLRNRARKLFLAGQRTGSGTQVGDHEVVFVVLTGRAQRRSCRTQ